MKNLKFYDVEAEIIDRPSVHQEFCICSDHGYIHELFYENSSDEQIEEAYRIYFPDLDNWFLVEAGCNADHKVWINLTYRTDKTGIDHYSVTADYANAAVYETVVDVFSQRLDLNYNEIPNFIEWLESSLSEVDYDGPVKPFSDSSYSDDEIILGEDDLIETI